MGALSPLDRQLCTEAAVAFFVHLDRRRYDRMLDLLAEDAVWVRRGERLSGRAAIAAALEARSPALLTRHLVANVHVEPDGEAAAVRLDLLVFQHEGQHEGEPAEGAPAAVPGPAAVLTSHDRLVRTPDGWRIARKQSSTVFRVAP